MEIAKNKNSLMLRPGLQSEKIFIEAGASLVYVFFMDQNGNQNYTLKFVLRGPNAVVKILGFNIGDQGKSSLRLDIIHQSSYTTGYTWIKSVLAGSAKSEIHGMIHMEKDAQGGDGYFTHNTLLLSKNAQGKSSPTLEIVANEVKASHSATVGNFDNDILFYLNSRGIESGLAKRLVMASFVQEYLNEIPDIKIRKNCENILENKLNVLL